MKVALFLCPRRHGATADVAHALAKAMEMCLTIDLFGFEGGGTYRNRLSHKRFPTLSLLYCPLETPFVPLNFLKFF